MLKPYYSKREVNPNYKLGYGFGNEYFDSKKTRGIIEYYVNGYSVRFIPEYDENKYAFPPEKELLEWMSYNVNQYKDTSHRRMYSFYNADLVFYVKDQYDGKTIVRKYADESGNLLHPQCLINCISKKVYDPIYQEVRTKFPYLYPTLPIHVRRNDVLNSKIVEFLDKKFIELKSQLSIKFRNSIFP